MCTSHAAVAADSGIPEPLRRLFTAARLPEKACWQAIKEAVAVVETDADIDAGRKKLRSFMRSLPLSWILRLVAEIHANFPKSAAAFAEHARVTGETLAWEESIALWQQFLDIFPRYSGGYTEIAYALRQVGRTPEAAAFLELGWRHECASKELAKQRMLLSFHAEQARAWQAGIQGLSRPSLAMCRALLLSRKMEPQTVTLLLEPLQSLLGLKKTVGDASVFWSDPPEALIFVGGYGWSGSTAVSDLLKECSCVFDPLPDVGEYYALETVFGLCDFHNLKNNADEGRVFCQSDKKVIQGKLLDFYFAHILGFLSPPGCQVKENPCDTYNRQNFAIISIYSDNEFLKRIGQIVSLFYIKIIGYIDNAEGELKTKHVIEFVCASLSEMFILCIDSGRPKSSKFLLIDNAIHPVSVNLIQYFTGNIYYIAIRRDIRDQCLSWRREPWKMGVSTTIEAMLQYVLNSYKKITDEMLSPSGKYSLADITFESFVKCNQLQTDVLRWLNISEEKHDKPATRFFPDKSSKRIGYYDCNLDQETLAALGKAHDGALRDYMQNPARFKNLD